VKLFGCKIYDGGIQIDLNPFSQALLTRTAHPEISLTISANNIGSDLVVVEDSEVDVSVMPGRLPSAASIAPFGYTQCRRLP
jgi:hypothetical protein